MHIVSKIALVALALVGGAAAGDGDALNPSSTEQQLASTTKGEKATQDGGEQVVQDKAVQDKAVQDKAEQKTHTHVTWTHFESNEGHPENAVCYQIDLHAQAAHEQQKAGTDQNKVTTDQHKGTDQHQQQKEGHDQQALKTGTNFLEQDGDQQKAGTDQNKVTGGDQQKAGTDQNKVTGGDQQKAGTDQGEKVCWLCHSAAAKEQVEGDGTAPQFLELLSAGVTCEDIAKRASTGEHFHCVHTELEETTGVDNLATPSPCKHHHKAVVGQNKVEGDGTEHNKEGHHTEGHKEGHKDKDVDDSDDTATDEATEQLPSNN